MKNLLLILTVVAALANLAAAAEPVSFRGPGGTGVFADTGLPTKWTADENIRWKAELPGRGLSQPVIAGGKVFLTACTGPDGGRLHVLALDLATGRKLWERQFAATGLTGCHPKTCMAAPTPVTDGKRVFALFATTDLVALSDEGDLLWYRSLVRDYPTVSNQVGMASSPLLVDDVLVVSMETGGESFAAGIDAADGANRWKINRYRDINWTTPVVAVRGGKAEVLLQNRTELTAVDPATGSRLWAYEAKGLNSIVSPAVGGGLVFSAGAELTALKPGSDGKEPEVVWKSPKLRPGSATPVIHDGKVYAIGGAGILTCAEAATGTVLWQERLGGAFWASPMMADGKLYCVNEEGVTFVVDPSAATRVVAKNALGETILANPVAADGAIFLRSDKHLYCIGKK